MAARRPRHARRAARRARRCSLPRVLGPVERGVDARSPTCSRSSTRASSSACSTTCVVTPGRVRAAPVPRSARPPTRRRARRRTGSGASPWSPISRATASSSERGPWRRPSSASRPTTTTPPRAWCATARSSPRRRRSASRARSTTRAFPRTPSRYCLREAGHRRRTTLDYVGFYDKPLLKFERLLETYLGVAPRGLRSFLTAMPVWLKEKLFTARHDPQASSAATRAPILFAEHHESHAASAFYPVAVRRGGDPHHGRRRRVGDVVATASAAATTSSCSRELHFPHSLGLLYSAFTYYTGFKVNSGEYKVMGLAPVRRAALRRRSSSTSCVDAEGRRLASAEHGRTSTTSHGLTMTNGAFDRLFGGPPRAAGVARSRSARWTSRASIQVVTEEIMLRMARARAPRDRA